MTRLDKEEGRRGIRIVAMFREEVLEEKEMMGLRSEKKRREDIF